LIKQLRVSERNRGVWSKNKIEKMRQRDRESLTGGGERDPTGRAEIDPLSLKSRDFRDRGRDAYAHTVQTKSPKGGLEGPGKRNRKRTQK